MHNDFFLNMAELVSVSNEKSEESTNQKRGKLRPLKVDIYNRAP